MLYRHLIVGPSSEEMSPLDPHIYDEDPPRVGNRVAPLAFVRSITFRRNPCTRFECFPQAKLSKLKRVVCDFPFWHQSFRNHSRCAYTGASTTIIRRHARFLFGFSDATIPFDHLVRVYDGDVGVCQWGPEICELNPRDGAKITLLYGNPIQKESIVGPWCFRKSRPREAATSFKEVAAIHASLVIGLRVTFEFVNIESMSEYGNAQSPKRTTAETASIWLDAIDKTKGVDQETKEDAKGRMSVISMAEYLDRNQWHDVYREEDVKAYREGRAIGADEEDEGDSSDVSDDSDSVDDYDLDSSGSSFLSSEAE
jgi:hypothetical protein